MKIILSFIILLNTFLYAKSNLDYEPDKLFSTLIASIQEKDRTLLEQQLILSQNVLPRTLSEESNIFTK